MCVSTCRSLLVILEKDWEEFIKKETMALILEKYTPGTVCVVVTCVSSYTRI